MTGKRRGLGSRDLDMLIGGGDVVEANASGEDSLRTLPLSQIAPGRYQPRQKIDEARLAELAASIKSQGLIQPIVVHSVGRDRYELIAGERRWRAAQQAGLSDIPAVVREVPPQAVLAMALIENIQREELTALEEAHALNRLIEEFALTQQQAADAVGRSRAAVANLLRLLDLPAPIRRLLENGELEMGHARALLALGNTPRAIMLAERAAAEQWSVRDLEKAVRLAQLPTSGKRKERTSDPDIAALERELSEKLGARVQISHGRNGRGSLTVRYHSSDELDGIIEKLR